MKSTKIEGASYHIGEIPLLRRVGVLGVKSLNVVLFCAALKLGFCLPTPGRAESANQVSYIDVFLQCDVRYFMAKGADVDTALWVIRMTMCAPVAHRE